MKFHNLQKLKPGMLIRLERSRTWAQVDAADKKVFGTKNFPERIKSVNPCNEIGLQDYIEVPSPSVAIFLQHGALLTNIVDFIRKPQYIQCIVVDRTLWFETILVYNLNQKQDFYVDNENE